MGSGLGVLFTFFGAYSAFIAGHNIAALWLLALSAFLFASYRAWRTNHLQLLAAREGQASAAITGEIREVYLKEEYNLDLFDQRHHYDDLTFSVNIYIANHGSETTVKEYRLVLRQDDRAYQGEKIWLEKDFIVRTPGRGSEEMKDIEKLNHIPLVHGRDGWLRFEVKGVQEDENAPQTIEIDVVDKTGHAHKLIGLPQQRWRRPPENGFPELMKVIDWTSLGGSRSRFR